MNDPNRVVERVERLIAMARSAHEEAVTIASNARLDKEPRRVIEEAEKIIHNFNRTFQQ